MRTMGIAFSGAVGAVSLAIAFLLIPTGCNLPLWSGKSSSVQPDSVRGDTTFYSCRLRTAPAPPAVDERVWVFATFGGYWHMRYIYGGRDMGWLRVPTTLNLYCDSAPDSTRAEALIREIGGTVVFRGSGFWGIAFVVDLPSTEPNYVTADEEYMRYLVRYSSHRDVFIVVEPSPPRFSTD
jgi:hypothetical protein